MITDLGTSRATCGDISNVRFRFDRQKHFKRFFKEISLFLSNGFPSSPLNCFTPPSQEAMPCDRFSTSCRTPLFVHCKSFTYSFLPFGIKSKAALFTMINLPFELPCMNSITVKHCVINVYDSWMYEKVFLTFVLSTGLNSTFFELISVSLHNLREIRIYLNV